MKKIRGFTLFEAICAITIFSLLMILIFSTMNSFTKAWKKASSRQNVNRQFTVIYKTMNKDISISSLPDFIFYNEISDSQPIKWFVFPSAVDQYGVYHYDNDGYAHWLKTVLYYLIRPDDCDCISYDCCPHKMLIRKELSDVYTYDQDIYSIIQPHLNLDMKIKGNVQNTRLVEKDIYDINLKRHLQYLSSEVIVLRIEDARGSVSIGTQELSKLVEEKSKFINTIKWNIIAKNH